MRTLAFISGIANITPCGPDWKETCEVHETLINFDEDGKYIPGTDLAAGIAERG